MASLLTSVFGSALSSLIGGLTQQTTQAQIDPTLLSFLQGQGNLAARFQGSQEGLPMMGSTATTGRAGFNQYGALLSANQTAQNVASAQNSIQNALNAGNQLSGTAAGLTAGATSGA